MIKKMELPLILESMAILVGTIIGGGIFVLPYINIKSGILISNFWLLLLCIIMCILHLIFGEIILKTDKEMKLPGYAGYYLGNMVKKFLNFVSIFSIAFSLLIYILLADKFIHIIMGNNYAFLKPYTFVLVWLVLNVFLFLKMIDLSKCNFILTLVLMVLMVVLSFLCFQHLDFSNLIINQQLMSRFWYISYGVIFFAIDGLVAMPMMFMFLKHKNASKTVYKKSVILSYIFVFIIFFLFMNSVSLLSKNNTTIDTFSGLIPFLGRGVLIMGALIGLLAIITSYIVFVNYYKDMLRCDIGCNKLWSILITMFLPLMFLLLNADRLDDLMSLVGGVIGGMIAVIVLLIYQKVKNINSSIYNLNLPNWFVFITGSFCFIGALLQVILRLLHLG